LNFVTYTRRFGSSEDSFSVSSFGEHKVDVVTESGVVDQAEVVKAVLLNQLLDFGLGKFDLKGAKASAELSETYGVNKRRQTRGRKQWRITP